MISVIVTRFPGDRQGPDIVDPLITSDTVAIERGRNEIDASYSSREIVNGSGPLKNYLTPGKLISVLDFETGPWQGKITQFSLSLSREKENFAADMNVGVERVA